MYKKKVIIGSWLVGLCLSLCFFRSALAEPSDKTLLATWKSLTWQEQAQCGTSVAKAMVDIVKSSSQHSSLRPFLYWIITLADDGMNFYNSWQRKDQEFYSAFWLMRDLFYAAKELSEEPSLDDVDLFDTDDYASESCSTTVNLKKTFPSLSPLVNVALSLYGIVSKESDDHKKRILAQGVKSLLRCGRWYFESKKNDKKSFETRAAFALSALNVLYLGKNLVTSYPANSLPKSPDNAKIMADVGVMTDPLPVPVSTPASEAVPVVAPVVVLVDAPVVADEDVLPVLPDVAVGAVPNGLPVVGSGVAGILADRPVVGIGRGSEAGAREGGVAGSVGNPGVGEPTAEPIPQPTGFVHSVKAAVGPFFSWLNRTGTYL